MPDRSTNEFIIGVTGHRIFDNPDPLIASVDEVLNAIRASFGAESIALLSPLAEGADRIIASRAIAIDETKLIAVLPFPPEIYEEDFRSPSSKKEFRDLLQHADEIVELPRNSSRDGSYQAIGEYIVAHCDVLIAIWDGKPARGPGGTAEVVAIARDRDLPLAWIFARQGLDNTSDFPEANHGDVSFERFPDQIFE